ncbi:YcaO-like family protein [Mesorhizobium sp. 1B3]|uniref:YcaO-like family protein n=1 Tax=Mesorhizobium sp. 1B3 TaxID=3243599 RepID=UPI003D9749C6
MTQAADRQVPADATVRSLGITRLGDLTGLDVIGLPVWMATRPNSRSLCVSLGKGLTHEGARLGAVMEAAETAIAEAAEAVISSYGSYAGLADRTGDCLPLGSIFACRYEAFDPERERGWIEGRSWATGKAVLAPYELVGLDMRSDAPWDRNAFRISSIGLAAAFDLETARLNALLEVIENDAVAPFEEFGLCRGIYAPASADREGDDALGRALRLLVKAGVDPVFLDLTPDHGVPVAGCFVPRPASAEEGPGLAYSAGFACRPDPDQALLAALLEAVQSRLGHIAGSRDDIEGIDYRPVSKPPVRGPAHDLAAFRKRPSAPSGPDSAATFRVLAAVLARAGILDVYVFDLPPAGEIRVAKVIAPGLRFAAPDGATTATPGMAEAVLRRLLEET